MPREKIVKQFSEWAAFSAIRSRSAFSPKSRVHVYPLIRKPNYEILFTGSESVSKNEFSSWHKEAVSAIQKAVTYQLPVGWAVKLINVYLKSRCYVANEGRPNLIEVVHPPIDQGLWKGVKRNCANKDILKNTHVVGTIGAIRNYETYETIIEGLRQFANSKSCLLIEVEQYWEGTA